MSETSPDFVLSDWDADVQRFRQREAPTPTFPTCFVFDTCPMYKSEEED